MTSDSIPVRRQLAGALLRHHRKAAGYTLEDAASAILCDKSKVCRIETGQRGVRPGELRELLSEYGVAEPEQHAITSIARHIRKGWWDDYRDVLANDLLDLVMVEPLAAEILIYDPQTVPAFFQTRGYALAAAAGNPELSADTEREQAVRMASARQGILLQDQAPGLTAVIGEAAFVHQVGSDEVMYEQLRLLSDVTGNFPSVTLQVLPFAAGAHPGSSIGPVSILRLCDAPGIGVIHQAGIAGSASLTMASALASALRRFEMLRATALTPEESRQFITQIAADRTRQSS
jgi:transcriptional regulator with XRE-family HTH domain